MKYRGRWNLGGLAEAWMRKVRGGSREMLLKIKDSVALASSAPLGFDTLIEKQSGIHCTASPQSARSIIYHNPCSTTLLVVFVEACSITHATSPTTAVSGADLPLVLRIWKPHQLDDFVLSASSLRGRGLSQGLKGCQRRCLFSKISAGGRPAPNPTKAEPMDPLMAPTVLLSPMALLPRRRLHPH